MEFGKFGDCSPFGNKRIREDLFRRYFISIEIQENVCNEIED